MSELEREQDAAVDRVIAFLDAEGAASHGHGPGRSLLDHLGETAAILRRWGQPEWLQRAALVHSVYGTESRSRRLVAPRRRAEVAELVGERAERIAWLFAAVPRRRLSTGTHRWAPGAVAPGADRDELDAVVMLHLANLAEQARGPAGSPAPWLATGAAMAELLHDSKAVVLPAFAGELAGVTPEEESAALRAYREGLAATDAASRADRLAQTAAACPVVGEPCVWLADAAWRRAEPEAARTWAIRAQRRLVGFGVAWDKRLAYERWLMLAERLAHDPGVGEPSPPAAPAALDEEMSARPPVARRATRLDPAAAERRFARYMDTLADAPGSSSRQLYPELDSQPWFEPDAFPVAVELERNFESIRAEILALEPSRFAPESERIERTGEWDVIFLYERGRRHDDVCEACPVTTSVIEGEGAMRTPAGLIYVSRMRGGTHIAAHRGPTNLRLRCHLGITVPDGDCAIRVGGQPRRWDEGRCLVFDDSYDHEAWNHTGADRIVLIVDLWHMDLSPLEVHRLAGLQRYAAAYAGRLGRYWSANEAARQGGSPSPSPSPAAGH
jgi:aspartyl/asparaginyl beta-hydroxylase (cupin superfamily)